MNDPKLRYRVTVMVSDLWPEANLHDVADVVSRLHRMGYRGVQGKGQRCCGTTSPDALPREDWSKAWNESAARVGRTERI